MRKSVVRVICFFTVLVFVLAYANKVFKVKYGDGIYGCTKFYSQDKNSVDVLVLGSSHAFEDINTGVLWNEYGYSSYILAGSIQPMWNTYYYLKEALKYQLPQLIVLEGYTTTQSQEFIDDSRIIKNTYGLKWSKDKLDAIKVSAPKERWTEFILEYEQYHTRYRELSKSDFYKNQGNPRYVNWKGFGCNMATAAFDGINVEEVTGRGSIYEKSEKYYRMTIELAKSYNIPIIIVISPYARISEWEQCIFNTASDIAAEYDVPFINYNLLTEEIGLDFSADMADGDHLNYRGNQKFTKVLGQYIKDNFDISDHRGDAAYQSWQDDADYVTAEIEDQILREATDRNDMANMLVNSNYVIIASVDGNCQFTEEELGSICNAIGIDFDNESNDIYYRDNAKGISYRVSAGEKRYVRLDPHDLCMERVLSDDGAAYLNKIVIDNTVYKKVSNGMNIVVYDKVTQKVADSFGINKDDAYNVVR